MPDLFGKKFDISALLDAFRKVRAELPSQEADLAGLAPKKRKELMSELNAFSDDLAVASVIVDPIKQPGAFFDPTNPHDAAGLLSRRLEAHPREKIGAIQPFYGSGVYALYYSGNHPAYAPLVGTEIPIYVGKVEPELASATTPKLQGTKLYDRLNTDHCRSIRNAEQYASTHASVDPILLAEFECRYLVLPSTYAAAVETALINHYQPVWATAVCKGFGKHGDAATRRSNTRSEWDTLHPGRPWATSDDNTPNPKSPQQIAAEVIGQVQAVRQRLGI